MRCTDQRGCGFRAVTNRNITHVQDETEFLLRNKLHHGAEVATICLHRGFSRGLLGFQCLLLSTLLLRFLRGFTSLFFGSNGVVSSLCLSDQL